MLLTGRHITRVSKAIPCDFRKELTIFSNLAMCGAIWRLLRTATLLTGTFLLECGCFLASEDDQWIHRPENVRLCQAVHEAAYGIGSCLPYWLHMTFGHIERVAEESIRAGIPNTVRTLNALILIWPLFVVYKTPSQADQRLSEWARSILVELGTKARIPKALALVSDFILLSIGMSLMFIVQASSKGTLKYAEVIDGVLLLESSVGCEL